MAHTEPRIQDLLDLRDRAPVFRDRAHAGGIVAGMLEPYRGSNALVLAIPAGGAPVAVEIARRLGLELDVAPVSKILLPWTTEAGYGAVAFDGSVWVNRDAVMHYGLTERDLEEGRRKALAKVERRVQRFRGERPFPELWNRPVILVDDGIAAGSTMRAAVAALRGKGAAAIVIAVPTGHQNAVMEIAREADALYCANIRGGFSFAVADAYELWADVDEDEAASILLDFVKKQRL